MEKVKKEPIGGKQRTTQIVRIKNIHLKLFKKVGKGNQQLGIEKIIYFYERMNKDPEAICMRHISDFIDDVEQFYGKNHVKNMNNLPSVLRTGLRQGGNCDFSKMNMENTDKKDDASEKDTDETEAESSVEK